MDAIREPIEAIFREERGRILAGLIRALGDFDLAEDALQEAFESALQRWPAEGLPPSPAGWLALTARRKALDRLRRAQVGLRKAQEAALSASIHRQDGCVDDDNSIDDDRLRLIFTCCHPALAPESRVALTLRTLGGLTTLEIARAFLVSEATLAQRLVRAKQKIRLANIPYAIPADSELPARLDSVLGVIYLIFNEGYDATSSDSLIRRDLLREAIRLGATLVELMPDEPEALGLLAMMLLHDSRREARVDAAGELVLLQDQDRSRWDHSKIHDGVDLLDRALSRRRPGVYQLQAALAAVHAQAPTAGATDWQEISLLYARLKEYLPSPVVELNRAVAIAMDQGPMAGLAVMQPLADQLHGYQPYHAAVADLLARTGSTNEAANEYRRALALTGNAAERRFLERRLAALPR